MDLKVMFRKKISKKLSNHVSNLCYYPKNSREGSNITFLKLFLNAMIMNIKIHNIFEIIEIFQKL